MVQRLFILFMVSLPLSLLAQQNAVDYGMTKAQIELLNLDCLHARGYTGKGVTIAHFDDGYDGFDQMKAFNYARQQNLLRGQYDFADNGTIEYAKEGTHGTNTLSIVNGYIPGEYVGVAYDAEILLARTEYTPSETHKEEHNWRRAVSWADSLGADIITSSLQYNNFDPGEGNYTYKDMDGDRSIIARAADEAARRGILVVTIQGNFGTSAWRYVTTPGDADSVLTVGAVGTNGNKAGFSSFGPSADGQIKPDVMAVGFRTIVVDPDGKIRPGNGTSFAAPCMAGLVACLKQAHPQRSNMEIINAVRQSADRYLQPDTTQGYGYGVPDACVADDILSRMDEQFAKSKGTFENDQFSYRLKGKKLRLSSKVDKSNIQNITLFNTVMQPVRSYGKFKKKIKLKKLPKGHYTLHVQLKDGTTVVENLLYR